PAVVAIGGIDDQQRRAIEQFVIVRDEILPGARKSGQPSVREAVVRLKRIEWRRDPAGLDDQAVVAVDEIEIIAELPSDGYRFIPRGPDMFGRLIGIERPERRLFRRSTAWVMDEQAIDFLASPWRHVRRSDLVDPLITRKDGQSRDPQISVER